MRTNTIIRRLNKAQPHNINSITIDDNRNWAEWVRQVKPEEVDLYTADIDYSTCDHWGLWDKTDEELAEMLEKQIVEYLSEKSLSCSIIKCSARNKSLYVIVDKSQDGNTNINADVIQAFVNYIRLAFTSKHN